MHWTMPRRGRKFEILLVEDNEADARLVIEALREAAVPVGVRVVRNGEQALAYLHRRTPYHDAGHPSLVLLDLNLPRSGGREVLAALKSDPGLRRLPVVVLSTSRSEDDVLESYDLHANCYISKPAGVDEFFRSMRLLAEYWFGAATLPRD